MRSLAAHVVALSMGIITVAAATQQPQTPAAGGARPDVYHVNFSKAVPGQAEALGKALMVPDKTRPMPDHFVVLRHNEGDDWDYAVIEHLGPKAEVTSAPRPPNEANTLRAWHNDTFVAGPSWPEFTKAMGIGAGAAANMVYIVGVHRAVQGHREQLEKALTPAPAPGSKLETGNVLFQHLEGGEWMFLSITRFNSWQDFATGRMEAAAAAGAAGGWNEIRQHSAFHRDTIVERIFPK